MREQYVQCFVECYSPVISYYQWYHFHPVVVVHKIRHNSGSHLHLKTTHVDRVKQCHRFLIIYGGKSDWDDVIV